MKPSCKWRISALVAGCLWWSGAQVAGQELQYPVAAVAAADGTLYIADRDFHGIWKFADGKLEKFFQGAPQYRTPLNAVRCLALDHEGALLAGDSATREVYRFTDGGEPVPLTSGKIGIPTAIAVRPNGEILVADQELACVWKIPAAGGEPVKLAEVKGIVGVCLDQDGDLWVTSRLQTQLLRIDATGAVEELLTDRPFVYPQQIALDGAKTAYVADNYANVIWKVPAGGAPQKWVEGAPLMKPVGLARDGESFLVTDPGARAVYRIDASGQVTRLVPAA
jgi:sugar lactone lactonase YvrE